MVAFDVTNLLVVVLALLPGVPGEILFRTMRGIDSSDNGFNQTIRLLGFSVFGVVLYSLVVVASENIFPLPHPDYLVLQNWEKLASEDLLAWSLPYFLHSCFSLLASFLVVWLRRLLARRTGTSSYANCWDTFAKSLTPSRMAIIQLSNGEKWAGYISTINTGSDPREFILQYPSLFCEKEKKFFVQNMMYSYFSYEEMKSLALAYNDNDHTESPFKVGEELFDETVVEEKKGE